MTEAQAVQWTMLAACGIGGLVAWGACLYSNYLDRKERGPMVGLRQPRIGEAPTLLTAPAGLFGVVVVLLLGTVVNAQQPYIDGCDLIDPSTLTWAEYLMWLAAGCWW